MWQLLPGFAPACGLLMDAHSPRNTAAAICAGRGGGGGSSSGGSNGGSVGPLAAYIDGAARACSRWEAQRTASLRALTALVNAITTRAYVVWVGECAWESGWGEDGVCVGVGGLCWCHANQRYFNLTCTH